MEAASALFADWLNSPPPPLLLLLLGPLIIPLVIFELVLCRLRPTKTKRPPPSRIDWPSAVDLAAQIRCGARSSRRLTEDCIARLECCEGVNAVTASCFEAALKTADAADAAIVSDSVPDDHRGLLWGVPVVIKECFEMPGLPFTAGIVGRRGRVGVETCPAIARLSGQPILATTNVSEACMFHESCNAIYGRTRNPHDPARTPGGSSGGCGALVAAGCSPLAVTSDVGGSTRIPALYCGNFGHKPTGGTVPNTRTLPVVYPTSLVSRYCQLGPTARHAVDLWPLLCKLAGPDGTDSMVRQDAQTRLLCANPHSVEVCKLKVIVLEELFMPWPLSSRLHPAMRRAQAVTAAALEGMGIQVERWGRCEMRARLPEMTFGFSIWAAMLGGAQPVPFRTLISDGRAPGDDLSFCGVLLEALRCLLCGGETVRHTLPAVALALIEDVESLFPSARVAMAKKGAVLRARLDKLLGDGTTVLLLPSLPTPAPRHHENLLRFPDVAQTAIFNVMQLPATAIPLGSEGGLPLGCQAVAGFGRDELSIALAIALERAGVARSVDACP